MFDLLGRCQILDAASARDVAIRTVSSRGRFPVRANSDTESDTGSTGNCQQPQGPVPRSGAAVQMLTKVDGAPEDERGPMDWPPLISRRLSQRSSPAVRAYREREGGGAHKEAAAV